MSDLSNNQGRAYEYICLLTLSEEINKIRKAEIEKNSAYYAAEHAWFLMSDGVKSILSSSANAVVSTIFDMEPMIIEQDDDVLTLKIQTDNEGKEGDVRDIVIARSDVQWEIGLSLKHNHFAVKHSRLAKGLDFDGVCTVKTKEYGEWYQDADLCVGMQKGEWSVDFYGNKSSGSTFCAGNKCVCGGSDHLWFNSGEQCERNCASRCAKEMLESDEHYANEDRRKELCEVGFGVIADKNVKYDEDRELCVLKIKEKVKKWRLSRMVENFGHGCKLQPVRANDPIAPYASADVWCPDIGFNMLIDMDNYQEE